MSKDPMDLSPANRLEPDKGRLLVSEPFLSDLYFRRTVILLCEHSEEGSFGFVLNRFIDIGLNDLIDGLPKMRTRISIGGPVQSSDLFYIHTLGERIAGSVEVINGIYMGGEFDAVRHALMVDPSSVRYMRFFVGYSGWGNGQLANEMKERSWLVSKADRGRIMNTRGNDQWGDTLRGMGKVFAPLANFPEDPSLN